VKVRRWLLILHTLLAVELTTFPGRWDIGCERNSRDTETLGHLGWGRGGDNKAVGCACQV
jgi:hypothetical protein